MLWRWLLQPNTFDRVQHRQQTKLCYLFELLRGGGDFTALRVVCVLLCMKLGEEPDGFYGKQKLQHFTPATPCALPLWPS